MDRSDARSLLTALRDLLASAERLVQHLLVLHGGPDSIVTPPPLAQPALPALAASTRRTRAPAGKARRGKPRRR